jgi:hypothetical protein
VSCGSKNLVQIPSRSRVWGKNGARVDDRVELEWKGNKTGRRKVAARDNAVRTRQKDIPSRPSRDKPISRSPFIEYFPPSDIVLTSMLHEIPNIHPKPTHNLRPSFGD